MWIGLPKRARSFWKGLIFFDRRWRETCPILLLDDGYALKSSKQLKSVWNSCAKSSLTWDMPKRHTKRGGNSRRTCKHAIYLVQGKSKYFWSNLQVPFVASHHRPRIGDIVHLLSFHVELWFLGWYFNGLNWDLCAFKVAGKQTLCGGEKLVIRIARSQTARFLGADRTVSTGSNMSRILIMVSVCGVLIFHSLRGSCYCMVNSWWAVIFILFPSIELAGARAS